MSASRRESLRCSVEDLDGLKDLVERLLYVNIMKRLTAAKALEHPWFSDMKSSL